jgi:hypothetical protein
MDAEEALRVLTEAAERFVNKAPNQKRLESDRAALLDAIMHAQLLLSIKTRGPKGRAASPAAPKGSKRRALHLAK